MKALIISSLLFFSLRAMSAEVGEEKKSECAYADQSGRKAKVVETVAKEVKSDDKKGAISK